MKEMKTDENVVALLSTAIGTVVTLAAGIGLSVLFNGFVQGFLALTVIAVVVACFAVWRAQRHSSGGRPATDRSGGARG